MEKESKVIDLTICSSDEEEEVSNENEVEEREISITKFTHMKSTCNDTTKKRKIGKAEHINISCFSNESKQAYEWYVSNEKMTYVAESLNPFFGRALYAGEKINNGEYICLYHGKRISIAECSAIQRSKRNAEYLLNITKGVYIDGCKSGRGGALANHSCSPNAKLEHIYLPGPDGAPIGILRALKEIKLGDEIETDYGYWDAETDETPDNEDLFEPCRCMRVNCRGVFKLKE